jgi:hypothetical protein
MGGASWMRGSSPRMTARVARPVSSLVKQPTLRRPYSLAGAGYAFILPTLSSERVTARRAARRFVVRSVLRHRSTGASRRAITASFRRTGRAFRGPLIAAAPSAGSRREVLVPPGGAPSPLECLGRCVRLPARERRVPLRHTTPHEAPSDERDARTIIQISLWVYSPNEKMMAAGQTPSRFVSATRPRHCRARPVGDGRKRPSVPAIREASADMAARTALTRGDSSWMRGSSPRMTARERQSAA